MRTWANARNKAMTSDSATNTTECYGCRNSTAVNTQFKNPLSVHGGFIAMAAGLSVVVPLVCVLIIQLRRARREERDRRQRQNGTGDQESGTESVNDPPPAYEHLFGVGYEPNLSNDHRTLHGSSDTLVVDRDGSGGGVGGIVNPAHQSDDDSGNDSGDGGDVPDSNSPPIVLPVSIISGNDVRDAVVVGSNTNALESGSLTPNDVVPLDVNRLEFDNQAGPGSPSSAPRSPPPVPPYESPSSSSPSSSSSPPPSSPPPPPPPPSSSSSHNSPIRPNLSDVSQPEVLPPPPSPPPPTSSSAPPPPPPPAQRMFPGMHISLQDFFSALRNQADREAPPPSYDEALKILEKAEKAKKKSNKKQ